MSKLYHKPPPPLNLAPALEPPLSRRHPADYLRLLTWLLYRPQTLWKYLDHSHSTGPHPTQHELRLRLTLQRELLHQMLVLMGISLFLVDMSVWFFLQPFVPVSTLLLGLVLGFLLIIVISGVWFGSVRWFAVTAPTPSTVVQGIGCLTLFACAASAAVIARDHPISIVRWGFAGVVPGILTAIMFYSAQVELERRVLARFPYQCAVGLLLCAAALLPLSLLPGIISSLMTGLRPIMIFLGVAALVDWGVVQRVDDWVLGMMRWQLDISRGTHRPHSDGTWSVAAVTALDLPYVEAELRKHLQSQWAVGVQSAFELTRYTRQHVLVYEVIYAELQDKKGEDVLEKVARLAPMQWDLRLFGHVEPLPPPKQESLFSFKRMIQEFATPPPSPSPLKGHPLRIRLTAESEPHAAVAGFWYLQQRHPQRAKEAFEKFKMTDYGKELIALAEALHLISQETPKASVKPVFFAKRPDPVKHKELWDAINTLQEVVRLTWVLQRSHHPDARLKLYQLLRTHLEKVINDVDPQQIGGHTVRGAAKLWLPQIDDLWADLHQGSGTAEKIKFVENPFVYAEPVRSGVALARRGERKEILDAWKTENFNNLLITGQCQIGKTTLILSAVHATHNIIPAYVNLHQLPRQATIETLLLALCDAIDESLVWDEPNRSSFQAEPYRAFQRYVGNVCAALGPSKKLIMILDALEELEQLDLYRRDPDAARHLFSALWELSQSYQNLGCVFVTPYTLEELRNKYGPSVATGLIDKAVGYLTETETRQLLQRPRQEFLPYFLDEAVTEVYRLTYGQPFLVQLIAYCVVDRFNQAASSATPRQPLFDVECIHEAQRHPIFKRHSVRYFQCLMAEIAAHASHGCQQLLCGLAHADDQGLSLTQVQRIIANSAPDCGKILTAHKIVRVSNDQWHISVPLLRRWLRHQCTKQSNSQTP